MINPPAMAPGWHIALSAGWITAKYILAVLFVRWLSQHPERQRVAAFISCGLMAVVLLSVLVEIVNVPSQYISPLLPDIAKTHAQLLLGVRVAPVLLGLFPLIHYFIKRRWLAVVITALVTYFVRVLWDIVWILMPDEVQNFGLF